MQTRDVEAADSPVAVADDAGAAGGASGEAPGSEQLREALWNIRRRYVLYVVTERGPVRFENLVERIARWETPAGGDVSAERRKSVRNALYQTHLPKLEAAGLIEYEQATGEVAARAGANRVTVYPASQRWPWDVGFAAWSLLFLAVAVLQQAGPAWVPGLAAIPWMGALQVAILVLTLGYLYDRRRRRHRLRDAGPDVVIDSLDRQ